MKLLLTSAGLTNKTIVNSLIHLAKKPIKQLNLAFVPTAANVEEDDKGWLIDDLVNCRKLGFNQIDIVDISAVPKDVWLPRLNQADVLLFGEGAEQFAKEQGVELVDPSYFYTEKRYQSLQKVKEREKNKLENEKSVSFEDPFIKDSKFGTVGCVALDKKGNLAAGTSTGGMTNKRWNRIGDSPIIGAGTYANNKTCAVSSTGWGEYFIRAMVAHDISAMMEYKGITLKEAAQEVIQNKVPKLGGDGGIVAIDKDGNIAMEFNTAGMYRAHMNAAGELVIGIYKEE